MTNQEFQNKLILGINIFLLEDDLINEYIIYDTNESDYYTFDSISNYNFSIGKGIFSRRFMRIDSVYNLYNNGHFSFDRNALLEKRNTLINKQIKENYKLINHPIEYLINLKRYLTRSRT